MCLSLPCMTALYIIIYLKAFFLCISLQFGDCEQTLQVPVSCGVCWPLSRGFGSFFLMILENDIKFRMVKIINLHALGLDPTLGLAKFLFL
jgi:hypothetical protein